MACEECGDRLNFLDATGTLSIAAFIWDKLLASDWDQSRLRSTRKKCPHGNLHITYEFPREDKVILQVEHIVGLQFDDYVPMMWEIHAKASPREPNFDFKYIRGRNPWGLNKAAVFSPQDLRELF